MDEHTHVNQGNARPGEYAKVIHEIGENKICPFCPEDLSHIHPLPLDERVHWVITDNAYPYKPKREHLLLIHKEHISDISELKKEAWDELYEIIQEVKTSREIVGGTFLMRFGETKFTGASVTHLHAHLFQSNPDDPEYDATKGVLTRVG